MQSLPTPVEESTDVHVGKIISIVPSRSCAKGQTRFKNKISKYELTHVCKCDLACARRQPTRQSEVKPLALLGVQPYLKGSWVSTHVIASKKYIWWWTVIRDVQEIRLEPYKPARQSPSKSRKALLCGCERPQTSPCPESNVESTLNTS